MARTVLKAPQYDSQELNTGDGTERGDSPKVIVDAINVMSGDLYGVNAQAGATVVDFGAYPGAFDASVAITGQTAIAADSIVEAWLVATATADHSVDEHWADPPNITVGNISPGVGFTIYAISRDGGRNYGQWTVQWTWR